jgi:septum formation protein
VSGRRLVLASTSVFRRDLLARLRLPFETAAPGFQEILPPTGPVDADAVRAVVRENAVGKALSLREVYPDALILASDQLGECEGRVLAKPGTEERAREQLRFLAGKEHRLHNAVALLDTRDGRLVHELVTSRLWMRPLAEERIRRYVELERPLHSAGSYLSESLGIALFDSLSGDDPTAIIGLPLTAVVRLLERFGVSPLDPWESIAVSLIDPEAST